MTKRKNWLTMGMMFDQWYAGLNCWGVTDDTLTLSDTIFAHNLGSWWFEAMGL